MQIDQKTVPERAWRAAMSTYHKTLRKNPGTAWQEAVAAAITAWMGGEDNSPIPPDLEGTRRMKVADRLFSDG